MAWVERKRCADPGDLKHFIRRSFMQRLMRILRPVILPATRVVPPRNTIDATLGEHILDVAVAQSEAEIEPDGLLDDDAWKAVAAG